MLEGTGAAPSPLVVERRGTVLHVMLDRPGRANALDAGSVERFLLALDDAQSTRELRALIITGTGDNFCGGFDLSQLSEQTEASLVLRVLRLETLLQRLYHAPYLTVACAQGNAVGAGADLFAACSVRIAEPATRFRMPGWQFGMALGTRRLCDRVGAGTAHRLLRESRTFAGTEALACGFATHVAERAQWTALAQEAVDATQLSGESLQRLGGICVPDHRDADMAALVASALQPPGLKTRMLAYGGRRAVRQSG